LIVSIVLLVFFWLNWGGSWNRFTCILLQRNLVNNLSNLRIAKLSIFQNFSIRSCIYWCLLFLFFFFFLSFLFLLFLFCSILIKGFHHFSFSGHYLFGFFYLCCNLISHLPLMLYHFCEWTIAFIFIFILILLTRYFLNLFIVTNSLCWIQVAAHPHVKQISPKPSYCCKTWGWAATWIQQRLLVTMNKLRK
jgi:hypothetical protein